MNNTQYDPTAIKRADDIVSDMVAQSPFTLMEVLSRRRGAKLVHTRHAIIHELNKRGFSISIIGDVLNRDPSTVSHVINKNKKSV